MDPAVEESGRRRMAATGVLDQVVGSGEDVVVRDGAALLVRRGGVVARVRPDADLVVTEREVDLAARLHRDGVPVVESVDGGRLWRLDGFVASCWRWVSATRRAGPEDMGRLVRSLRVNTEAGGADGLAEFDPLDHIIDVVGECGDDPDVAYVKARADALRDRYESAAASDPLGRAVVHGDLHAENVVVGAEGPLLLDLELGGWGPASYDTAPAVLAVRRYGAPVEHLHRFLGASGDDPRAWSGFEVLVQVYELWVTAWAVSVANRRPDWAAEAGRRVASLRDGIDRTWRLS